MLKQKHLIGLLSAILIGLAATPAFSQGIFGDIADQLGGRLEQEINRRSRRFNPPQDNGLPRTQSDIPSQGGGQNIDNRFSGGGFFTPGNRIAPMPSQPNPSNRVPSTLEYTPQPVPNMGGTMQGRLVQNYPEPVSRSSAKRNGLPIKLRCDKSLTQTVKYKLRLSSKAFPYTIRHGESQSFDDTRQWLVSFTRGQREITYRLTGGNMYTFDLDSNGELELFEELTVDGVIIPEPPKRDPS
jgi:hypothetical protein